MNYKYDKDELKNSLTVSQIFDFLAELGGDPKIDSTSGAIICRTICHNPAGTGSHKLYFYPNSKLFHCYTECEEPSFDIFELVRKVHAMAGESISLPQAIHIVAQHFGYTVEESEQEQKDLISDWEILKKYKDNDVEYVKKNVEFNIFSEKSLKYFPRPRIIPWEREGIDPRIMDLRNICYDPVNEGVIIPHYDLEGNLIGIRERTLIKEQEQYGKYRPAVINGKMYNHPLGFNLYNLNFAADNIKACGLAIIFEGEKSCLKYASLFGEENDISVATCGSNLITHQVDLLLQCGARELIIAFDKQFKTIGDEEYNLWVKKLKQINDKYSSRCAISFIFDRRGNLLNYKDSPIDAEPEIFMKMFKDRMRL